MLIEIYIDDCGARASAAAATSRILLYYFYFQDRYACFGPIRMPYCAAEPAPTGSASGRAVNRLSSRTAQPQESDFSDFTVRADPTAGRRGFVTGFLLHQAIRNSRWVLILYVRVKTLTHFFRLLGSW